MSAPRAPIGERPPACSAEARARTGGGQPQKLLLHQPARRSSQTPSFDKLAGDAAEKKGGPPSERSRFGKPYSRKAESRMCRTKSPLDSVRASQRSSILLSASMSVKG